MTQDANPGQNTISRRHLVTGAFDACIDRIEVHRVELPPAQKAGLHTHPGGVIGYVEEGNIRFAIEGQPVVMLYQGDVFYEPPTAAIAHFDNASDSARAVFVAFYPLSGDQPLITMMER